jgi:hypothetical protein
VHFLWRGGWFDTATNVLLFLPLGFLYRLTRKGALDLYATQVFWRAFLLSTGIELSQIFLPGRFSSPLDVLTNATGAWAGAWLHDQVQGKLGRQWVGRLALELPLMNIVYLLIPLLWLNGMASGNDHSRRWLTLLPGVCGGVILAAVYLNRLKAVGTLRSTTLSLAAGTWFVFSILPGFAGHPFEVMAAGIAISLLVQLLTSVPILHRAQRRFELPTLRRILVVYFLYLGLLTLWPLPAAFESWRGAIGFSLWPNTPGILAVLRLVELFAAFTLLG